MSFKQINFKLLICSSFILLLLHSVLGQHSTPTIVQAQDGGGATDRCSVEQIKDPNQINGPNEVAYRIYASDPETLAQTKNSMQLWDASGGAIDATKHTMHENEDDAVKQLDDGRYTEVVRFTIDEGIPEQYYVSAYPESGWQSDGIAHCQGASPYDEGPGGDSRPEPVPVAAPFDPCKDAQDKKYCDARVKCASAGDEEARCVSKRICEQMPDGYVYTSGFHGGQALSAPAGSNPALVNGGTMENIEPYGGCYNLIDFMGTLVNYLLIFASIIAGFVFSIGAYKYLTSRGDPSATADARDMMIQAVIGVVLLAMAFVLIEFLSGAFGSGVTEDINLIGPIGESE